VTGRDARPFTTSIKVVRALKNNQPVQKVANLVRFADAQPPTPSGLFYLAGLNGALGWGLYRYGRVLENAGLPPFSFWQGYVQTVPTGPNACAFAFNAVSSGETGSGSVELAYVGPVPAGATETVTLVNRGL